MDEGPRSGTYRSAVFASSGLAPGGGFEGPANIIIGSRANGTFYGQLNNRTVSAADRCHIQQQTGREQKR